MANIVDVSYAIAQQQAAIADRYEHLDVGHTVVLKDQVTVPAHVTLEDSVDYIYNAEKPLVRLTSDVGEWFSIMTCQNGHRLPSLHGNATLRLFENVRMIGDDENSLELAPPVSLEYLRSTIQVTRNHVGESRSYVGHQLVWVDSGCSVIYRLARAQGNLSLVSLVPTIADRNLGTVAPRSQMNGQHIPISLDIARGPHLI